MSRIEVRPWLLRFFAACLLFVCEVNAQPSPAESAPALPPSADAAQTPPTDAPLEAASPPTQDATALAQERRLAEAKALFQQGNAIRQTGDCQRALDFYLRSRALAPSPPNTLNAAFCLKELKRLDEALELYEQALVQFRNEINQATTESLGQELRALHAATAALEVSANVNGALVVDGRERGRLPLAGPVRLMPGQRTVRIIQDGYVTFEVELDLVAGQSRRLDAKLQPLASAGRVRIEAKEGEGAEVFVDGARVGALPWEGTLAPGKHLFALLKGDQGTAPAPVTVVQGQTVLMSVELKPLGPPIRITVEPSNAEVVLDRVALGSSSWQGRLPLGTHRAETSLEGYAPLAQEFTVQSGQTSDVLLKLQVDPNHPRWATGIKTQFWAEALGGAALAQGLGSGAEETCNCKAAALGFAAGVRAGFGLGESLSIELSAAWLRLGTDLSWSEADTFDSDGDGLIPPEPTTYHFQDQHRLRGVLGSAGLSYFFPLSKAFHLGARIHAGAYFASATNTIDASLESATETLDAQVEGSGSATRTTALFLWPELGARWNFGRLHALLGIGALIMPGEGNAHTTRDTGAVIDPSVMCMGATAGQADPLMCAATNGARTAERSFGPLVAFTPTLGVGYTF